MIEIHESIVQVETVHEDELDAMGMKYHNSLRWEKGNVVVNWSEIVIAGDLVLDHWQPEPPKEEWIALRDKTGAVVVIKCSLGHAAQAMQRSKR